MHRANNKHDSGLIRRGGGLAMLALMALGAGCDIKPVGDGAGPARPPPPAGRPAAAVEAVPARFLTGAVGSFSLESYKGRPLLISVLGAGTHDLPRVVSLVNRVVEESPSDAPAVVGLLAAIGPAEDPVRVAEELDAKFPVAQATPGMLAALGGVRALPTHVLVDGRGAVRKQLPGAVDFDELRAHLRDLASDSP